MVSKKTLKKEIIALQEKTKELEVQVKNLTEDKRYIQNSIQSLVKRCNALEKEVFKKEMSEVDIINDSLQDDRIDEALKYMRKGGK